MSDEVLRETCDECGSALVRTSGDDAANPNDFPLVTCPNCLVIVRRER